MTKSTITREQLIKKAQEQIEFCRHTKITGEGRAHVNQCAALFEIALAAMDSKPVAEVIQKLNGYDRPLYVVAIEGDVEEGDALYRHAQPAPLVSEVRPLVSEQSAPIALDDLLESCDDDRIEAVKTVLRGLAGNSLAHTDFRPEQNSVAPAQSPIDHGYRPECECLGCKATARICAELSANSPAIGIDLSSGPDRTAEVRYVAPPGYVMVPVEPTKEILDEFDSIIDYGAEDSQDAWHRLLAAAPQPQNAPQNIPEIIPDCWCRTCRPVVLNDMRFVVCPDCGNKRCPRANDHRNSCTGSNEPGQEGSAYPDTPREGK